MNERWPWSHCVNTKLQIQSERRSSCLLNLFRFLDVISCLQLNNLTVHTFLVQPVRFCHGLCEPITSSLSTSKQFLSLPPLVFCFIVRTLRPPSILPPVSHPLSSSGILLQMTSLQIPPDLQLLFSLVPPPGSRLHWGHTPHTVTIPVIWLHHDGV